jgi:DNA-directed RNA polymerase subunit N (RpoN/RPB10)
LSREVVIMPEPVRCDVCGKLFSSRHVKSHQRLAHAKDSRAAFGDEQSAAKRILELYKTLSAKNRERLRAELAALEHEPS